MLIDRVWAAFLCLIDIHMTCSALTRLGVIQPVKIEWWGVGVVICLDQGADCLHMVISCVIKIQTGFTLLVPAYPDCPGKEAVKWG